MQENSSATERTSNLKDFKILVSKCRIKSELDADTAIEISRALTEAYVKYKLANLPEKSETGIRDSYNHALKSLKNLKPTHLKTQIPPPPPAVVHKVQSQASKASKRKSKAASEATSEKRQSSEQAGSSSAIMSNSSGSTAGISIPFSAAAPMAQQVQGYPMQQMPVPGQPIPPGNSAMVPPGPPMMPQPLPSMFPTVSMPQMPIPPAMPPQMQFPSQPGVPVPQMPQPPPFMPGMPVSSSGFLPSSTM